MTNAGSSTLRFDYHDRSIVVDENAGTITFVRCHVPNRFFAFRAEPSFTCGFDEILAVQWLATGANLNDGQIRVVTEHGKADIIYYKRHISQQQLDALDGIHFLLSCSSDRTPNASVTQHALFPLVFGAVVSGIVIAVILLLF